VKNAKIVQLKSLTVFRTLIS